MFLEYFYDFVLPGHLGARKTCKKMASHFWWPKMQAEVFGYVRKCSLCQRAKPTQDTQVDLHSANPVSRPMQRLFMDFLDPLTRTKYLTQEGTREPKEKERGFWTKAYENLKRAKDRVAKRYDANRKPHQYQVDDLVMYRLNLTSSKAQNISAKLLLKWPKLVVIAKVVRPNVVLLANPDTGVILRWAHVSQLKQCVR
jgi:hypothetical protein